MIWKLDFSDIKSEDFIIVDEIRKMEPFGIGNPKPVFLTRKCLICGEPRFSRNEKHVFLKLERQDIVFDAVYLTMKN